MTQNSNPSSIIWSSWLYDNGIGIHPYESPGSEWYKPHQNCKMRYLGPPFCSVCKEETIQSIYSIIDLIDSYYPESLELTFPPWGIEYFSINPILNMPNTIEVEWFFNETIIAQNTYLGKIRCPEPYFSKSYFAMTLGLLRKPVYFYLILQLTLLG